MELNEFLTRLSRNSNPSDYLSRQGFGSRMTRTSGSSLLRDQGYGNQIAIPSYGTLSNVPSASSGAMPTGNAGIRPNFNRAWAGDMDFPTLSAIGNQAMDRVSRAQKRAKAGSGGYSGRGTGRGGTQQSGGGSPQGGGSQGGSTPQYSAPQPGTLDPTRPSRYGQTPPKLSRSQRRAQSARQSVYNDLTTLTATAQQSADTGALVGRVPRSVAESVIAGQKAQADADRAQKFAGLDASLAENFDVTAGGNIVPRQPTQVIGPEQSPPPPVRTTYGAGFEPSQDQLSQAERDKDSLTNRSRDIFGTPSYEDLSGAVLDTSKMSTTLEEGETYEQKKARLESGLRRNQQPQEPVSEVASTPQPAWTPRTGSPSSRNYSQDYEEFQRNNQQRDETLKQERASQVSSAASREASRRLNLSGMGGDPSEAGATTVSGQPRVGRPRQTIRGMSGAVQNILKMSESAKKANASNPPK
jgi:hypothetical protein